MGKKRKFVYNFIDSELWLRVTSEKAQHKEKETQIDLKQKLNKQFAKYLVQ